MIKNIICLMLVLCVIPITLADTTRDIGVVPACNGTFKIDMTSDNINDNEIYFKGCIYQTKYELWTCDCLNPTPISAITINGSDITFNVTVEYVLNNVSFVETFDDNNKNTGFNIFILIGIIVLIILIFSLYFLFSK